jgi:hypothetical protein
MGTVDMARGTEKKNRNYRVAGVIVIPALISVAITLFWKFVLNDQGLYFDKDTETSLLEVLLPLVGFTYVIFASIAVNSAFDRYKTIRRSVARRDVHAYLEHRDQHLPALLHVLVAIPSLILLFIALTHRYDNIAVGTAAVYAVSLVILITLAVINELDNDHKRKHFRNQIPKHWRNLDPNDFFEKPTARKDTSQHH